MFGSSNGTGGPGARGEPTREDALGYGKGEQEPPDHDECVGECVGVDGRARDAALAGGMLEAGAGGPHGAERSDS